MAGVFVVGALTDLEIDVKPGSGELQHEASGQQQCSGQVHPWEAVHQIDMDLPRTAMQEAPAIDE